MVTETFISLVVKNSVEGLTVDEELKLVEYLKTGKEQSTCMEMANCITITKNVLEKIKQEVKKEVMRKRLKHELGITREFQSY